MNKQPQTSRCRIKSFESISEQ